MSAKLSSIADFIKDAGISKEFHEKIRKSIRYNSYKASGWGDNYSLFNELPKALRFEVATSMYKGIIKNMPFFLNRDQAFIVTLMPLLLPL